MFFSERGKEIIVNIGEIKVVCPLCDNNMEISEERKNTHIDCPKCGNGFVAYEAVKCDSCGRLRHPRHPCRACEPESAMARKYRETLAREALKRLPEDLRTVLEFESRKNAELLEDMARRIADLESWISELEDKIGELEQE